MGFYKNTKSGVIPVTAGELLRNPAEIGDVYKITSADTDMIIECVEFTNEVIPIRIRSHNYAPINKKCPWCCFYGSCNFSPYQTLKFPCDPEERPDGKDVYYRRLG